jgi:sugar phosphate isomerase/epimerase
MLTAEHVGISSMSLPGLSLDDAVNRVHEGGFRTFEIVPKQYGHPQAFDAVQRKQLRDLLRRFDLVTVHSSVFEDVDSFSSPTVEDCQKVKQRHLDLVEFACDIGALVITFHPCNKVGFLSTLFGDCSGYLIDFARAGLKLGKSSGLTLGYEFFDREIISKIGLASFGELFDISAAIVDMEERFTENVLRLMEEHYSNIVEVHMHGVTTVSPYATKKASTRAGNNQLLDMDSSVDYGQVMAFLKNKGFQGPVVLEMLEGDWMKRLEEATKARQQLVTHLK